MKDSQVNKKEGITDQLEIVAQPRTEFGKGPAGRARRQGKTPGIVYGTVGSTTKHFWLEADDFMRIFKRASYNSIIKLILGEWSSDVVIKDYDYNVVRRQIRHVDLYEVQWADKVVKSVPLELVGKAAGQRDGGVIKQDLFEVKVKSMPMFTPKKMQIDISHLRIGDSLQVKNIISLENVEVVDGAEDFVVRLVSLQKEDDVVDEQE